MKSLLDSILSTMQIALNQHLMALRSMPEEEKWTTQHKERIEFYNEMHQVIVKLRVGLNING